MASAGMPIFADSANRSSSRAAPSSMENSVCVCRWTKLSVLVGPVIGTEGSLLARPGMGHHRADVRGLR
jgi:hypothetical protein